MTVPLIESFPQMKCEEMEANDMSTVIQFALLGFSDLKPTRVIIWGVHHHLHHYFNWKWPLSNNNLA